MLNAGLVYVATFAVAIAVAATVTPLVIRLARRLGAVHQAEEDRHIHVTPTPRIGGIAVFLGFVVALFAVLGYALASPYMLAPFSAHATAAQRLAVLGTQFDSVHKLVGLLFGGLLILGVGVWDDLMGLRPRNKFIAQVLVALISMLYGFIIPGTTNPFDHNPDTNWIDFPLWFSIPLTLLWYVGMMNAINFIDGLDGLLAGFTAISSLFMFAIFVAHASIVVAIVVIALAGAALGFLPYNFNPARIFLGDAGSLFIGYVFATVSIIGTSKIAIAISLLVPLVILALPVLDTAFVIIRRGLTGHAITQADRGHFHHHLVYTFGLNVRQAVLLIYALCFVLGMVALYVSGGLTHVFRHVN
jgi:UDP-GlcNAc:undecaprenyl-phosphate/decaprenyl-phosphate GlcNAc-1-phosphate transferase